LLQRISPKQGHKKSKSLIQSLQAEAPRELLYHAACHVEWSGVEGVKAARIYAESLGKLLDAKVSVSPHCCGESGLGAMTSPAIYNKLRRRKIDQLRTDISQLESPAPILVGCPSCRIGLTRCLNELGRPREVRHTVEYLASLLGGKDWEKNAVKRITQARLVSER